MASTMQLEFAQAMSDFKTMFPNMDRDVIEAVLRANAGAVDATIDQLLAMSIDNQNETLRNELDNPESNSPRSSSLSTDKIDGKQIHPLQSSPAPSAKPDTGTSPKATSQLSANGEGTSTSASTTGAKSKSRKWNPPILSPLPAGFLRLSSVDSRVDFEIPDEQFAMMLQNEEFMNELRWNEEFMIALEKEQQEKGRADGDLIFKERLKHMGKTSRKKFMQLAKVFTWQRNKKPGAVRHPDSLLLQEEHSDDDEPKKLAKK